MAKGFNKIPCETLSHLLKCITICLLLSLALLNSWIVHYLDVHNVFTHEALFEIVSMKQSPH